MELKEAKRSDQEPMEGDRAGLQLTPCSVLSQALLSFIKSLQNSNYGRGVTPPLNKATESGGELSFTSRSVRMCAKTILDHGTTLNLGSSFPHCYQCLNIGPSFDSWVNVKRNALRRPSVDTCLPLPQPSSLGLGAGFGKPHVTLQSSLSSNPYIYLFFLWQ